ncbi:restriction endonuclease PLD domain-containing protein [Acinetobacter guillouiae]|uniref:restriction endonuclease PLD domain-containing protein n=1 Tax=Acinetobacter guillouiae TaxID=106649 RepID=UPI00125F6BD3|nr:restriction endonuclease PLD domain-containing protein [Acinetobacter guillouiae]
MTPEEKDLFNNYPHLTLTLLKQTGDETGEKSGPNWGQRDNREGDEMYIPLPSREQNTGFFPSTGENFTVTTIDNKVFNCVRQQTDGKAITTVGDISLLGRYIREKMDIGQFDPVTKSDLENYGRTDVTFYKKSDKNFVMSFEVPVED